MIIQIKKHLIEEGVLQGVKDNWGKGLMAAGGLALAHANAFGPAAKRAVDQGGAALKGFAEKAGDWSKDSMVKLNNQYGTDANGDGVKTMGETKDSPLDPNSTSVEDGHLKDIQGPADESTISKVVHEIQDKIPDFTRKTSDDSSETHDETSSETHDDSNGNVDASNNGFNNPTLKDFLKSDSNGLEHLTDVA